MTLLFAFSVSVPYRSITINLTVFINYTVLVPVFSIFLSPLFSIIYRADTVTALNVHIKPQFEVSAL